MTGCPLGNETWRSGAESGAIGLVSLADYFAPQADGAQEKADQLGLELQVVDGAIHVAEQLNQRQRLITADLKVLAIVPSNTDIGVRAAIELADDAVVPLVAGDAPLEDAGGDAGPFVVSPGDQRGCGSRDLDSGLLGEGVMM